MTAVKSPPVAEELRKLVELIHHTPDWRVEDGEDEWHVFPPLSTEWWPIRKARVATPSVLEEVGKRLKNLGWTPEAAQLAMNRAKIQKAQASRRAEANYGEIDGSLPTEMPVYEADVVGDETFLPPGPLGGLDGPKEGRLYFESSVLITPELAEQMLLLNVEYNRPLSESNVDRKLVTAILRGEWILTNDAIGFDTNGKLYDGQKRLFAVMRAGVAVPFNLSYNNPVKAFEVVDTNQTRTAAQTLHSNKVPNAAKMSAASRLVFLFDNARQTFRYTMTNPQARAHYDSIAFDLQQAYSAVTKLITANRKNRENALMIPAAATAAYFVCKRAFPEGEHAEFVEGLATGLEMRSGDPRWVLREFLRNPRNKRQAQFHMALYIKAWNDFVEGRPRGTISWRDDEKMPVPLTAKPLLF